MIAIVDTDALIGLFNTEDALHTRSKEVSGRLLENDFQIAILHTTLAEFAAVAGVRIGIEKAKEAVNRLTSFSFISVDIDNHLMNKALAFFNRQTSRRETLFDCLVMAASIELSADCIFSFDEGYSKNNFVLAKNLLK